MKLKKVTSTVLRLIPQFFDMIITKVKSMYSPLSKKYEGAWLISERGTEAKDNGYVFFKYIRENHPEIDAYYVIDSSYTNDYNKVKYLGNIIEYKSLEHKIAFLKCKYAISTHIGYLEPWAYKLYKMILDRKNKTKFVLLQHGVIYNDLSDIYSKKATKLDLFITSTQKEYETISSSKSYGYKEGEVVKTGLARFDLLNDYKTKNQILLMPTWRSNIVNPSYKKEKKLPDSVFYNSEYFKRYNSLINNEKITKLLRENNYEMIFYPHYEIQQYIQYFNTKYDDVVKIAKKEDYDVQTLLKESKLLITDYSSVFFDFGYMEKPILYYHFDELHYKRGYFSYKDDGFGDIFVKEDDLVNAIEEMFNNDFIISDFYKDRISDCFGVIDDNNCVRIYNKIKSL